MAERAPLLDREQVIAQLVALDRQATTRLRYRDLPANLARSVATNFGGLENARLAAGIVAPSPSRKWSLGRVLDKMRALHRAGLVMTARAMIDFGHGDVMGAAYRYAGSLRRARVLARVPHPVTEPRQKEPWDEDRVVSEIRALHDRGKSIAYSKVEARLAAAAARYFGSYKNAVEAAGFDYTRIRLRREDYTRDEVMELLRDLSERAPNVKLADVHSMHGMTAAIRMFGSIENAVKAAGIRGWPKRQLFPIMSPSRATEKLRRRHRAGQPVFAAAVAKTDRNLWHSVLTHFSTWNDGLEAAGLTNDSPRKRTWTRALVLERMRERQRKGLSLRPKAVQTSDGSLYTSAVRLFGSYSIAARRLGVKTAKRRWTKAMVIRELRRAAGADRRLTTRKVTPAIVMAAQTLFGAFSKACGAAGLEIHSKRKWNRADVLRELRRLARAGKLATSELRTVNGLEGACRRYFGSVREARRAIGDG